jgi:membrane-associated phospholipid phosphatase
MPSRAAKAPLLQVRAYEWLLAAYFTYAGVLAAVLPVKTSVCRNTICLNLAVLAAYALLAWADSLRHRILLGVIRDWFPLALMLLAYREMGWFAEPHHTPRLENVWIVWDRLALERGGLHTAIEILGPVLPSILEIAYALVYTLGPFSVAVLYLYRRRERVERFLFPFVLAVLMCNAQYPLWPSEPPRTVFPGLDLPSYFTVFRKFNLWMLGGYGIHTSVFPSAHVAAAFSAAFGMRRALPGRPWVGRFLLVTAVLIATATVYGRYHYLADATAGLAMSLVALAITKICRI